MTVSHRQNRLLKRSDKEYYDLWRELGTLVKVSAHLRNLGEINPKLGQPYSLMTIRTAALRYVIENPELVKPDFDNENGVEIDQTSWDEYLVRTAMTIYDTSAERLVSWIKRHNMEKYDYIYSRKLPERKLVGR